MNFSHDPAPDAVEARSDTEARLNRDAEQTKPDSSEASTPASIQRLDEIAAQLAELNEEDHVDGHSQTNRPQVVFLDAPETSPQQIIEVTLADDAPIESVQLALANETERAALEDKGSENDTPSEPSSEGRYREPFQPISASQTRRCIDPFAYESDGAMPIMTSLPMLDDDLMSDEFPTLETAENPSAWMLHSAAPLSTQDADSTIAVQADSSFVTSAAKLDAKVTGAADSVDDCFYAEPGQVIFIDGEQGFDHIDLRSYDINCATFQPQAIVLHSSLDPSQLAECEEVMEPITIRHRGVDFAIFHGEIRVEL